MALTSEAKHVSRGAAIGVAWPLATGACVCLLVAIACIAGVRLGEALQYMGYIATCVALPGMLLYSVLSRARRFSLEHVVVGIPLGFALVVLGFASFSALGLRPVAFYVSPLVGVLCGVVARIRGELPLPRFRRADVVRYDILALLIVAALAIVLTSFEFFPLYPLPEHVPASGADYQADIQWHIGNAAGLKHSWPLPEMRMVGREFRYYLGAHMHVAAASSVTGIEVSTIFLRLDPLLFQALLALQLFWLGRTITGRGQGGVLTAAIALLASDLSLLHGSSTTLYLNLYVRDLFLSPSYALGMLIFVPLIVCMGRWVTDPAAGRWNLAIAAILLCTVMWVKSPAMPVVMAGCAGMALLDIVYRRAFPRRPVAALVLCLVTFAFMYPMVTMSDGGGYVRFAPFVTFSKIPAFLQLFGGKAGGAVTAPFRVVAVILGYAPVAAIGFAAYVATRQTRNNAFARWLLMLMLAGAGAVLLIHGAGAGQLWFWFYGEVGLFGLAALGYFELLGRYDLRRKRALALFIAAVTLCAVGSSFARARDGFLASLGQSKSTPRTLTPDRVEAYRWLRDHAPKDAIIAIDAHDYMYASALSERRFLLEHDEFMPTSYLYRFTGGKRGTPPDKTFRAATRRIFNERDEAALREVRDKWSVRYLIDDKKLDLPMQPFDASVANRVFGNDSIDIYEIVN